MKTIVYTQRVEVVENYNERRDCADQNIPRFLQECGYLAIPLPNVAQDLEEIINQLNPEGIVLTGGNSLVKYGGNAPERDETDHKLIEIAIEKNIPLYGFCRGMQSVLDYFECSLKNVKNHVAVRHHVYGEWGTFEVNSYHNQACMEIKPPLKIMSQTDDGVIEAAVSSEHRIVITMWHPERENPFFEKDIIRIKNLFG